MKTNLSFLIVLFIAVVAFLNDILIFFLKLDYLAGLIISFSITLVLLIVLLKKKKIILENYFNKLDFIFLLILVIYIGIKIVVPDFNWDPVNYHYYNQKYPFINKIDFDFFATGTSATGWMYPLGDRINYIFRFLLGIRLGTILQYFSLLVIFYEIKKILKLLKPNSKEILYILTGMCALFVPIFYRYIGTYNIDTYSIVFLIECFYVGIKEKSIFSKKAQLYYWFLISGIAVGIKVSNIVLIIPIGVNIIYNNIKLFKNLKLKDYIISLILFFLPFFVYGINNFAQMGNFLYPFLGRKKYFGEESTWNDPAFGIPNFWYSFIWPVIVAFFPAKGHNESFIYEYIWAFGYVFMLINMLIKIFKKDFKTDLFRSEIITFAFCILWANFMNGYCRYASIIPMLFIVNIVAYANLEKKQKILFKVFSGIQLITVIVIYFMQMNYDYTGKLKNNLGTWTKEAKNVFIDNNITIHIDGVWGCISQNAGMTSLIREDGTPMYTLNSSNIKKNDSFYEKYIKILKDKDIYVVTSSLYRPVDTTLKLLEEENFEVVEKFAEYDYTELPYLHYLDKWEIYKVRFKE